MQRFLSIHAIELIYMNVGILVNVFPKVSETFIVDHITGVIDRGHSVQIFSNYKINEKVVHDKVGEYDLTGSLQCFDISSSRIKQIIDVIGLIARNGYKYPKPYFMLTRDMISSPKRTGAAIYSMPSINRYDFDVIHCHFGVNGITAAKLKKVDVITSPIVVSFHGNGIREGHSNGGDIYEELFEYVDIILANSENSKEALIEFGADPDMVKIQHIGIDLDKFGYSYDSINDEDISILSVGRLVKEKNHKAAIEIINTISKMDLEQNIAYRIVGNGPLREKLEQLIEKYDLNGTISLVGAKTQSEVRDEMKNADIFLHPSKNEAFGKVLLEAQATGLPIVASNAGGIPDAVNAGNSAFITSKDNIEKMSTYLSDLILDDDLRKEMSLSGRKYVEDNFDINKLNDGLIQIYEDLLSNHCDGDN
jgi:colanic acid/amylovoran biosynthesis glycosyltransferase